MRLLELVINARPDVSSKVRAAVMAEAYDHVLRYGARISGLLVVCGGWRLVAFSCMLAVG